MNSNNKPRKLMTYAVGLCTSTVLTVGCSGMGGAFGAGGGSRSGSKDPKISADIAKAAANATIPEYARTNANEFGEFLAEYINTPGVFEEVAARPIAEITRDPRDYATNETFEVFGFSFSGMLDFLTSDAMERNRQWKLDNFRTVGDYWEYFGIKSSSDLSYDNTSDRFAALERILQSSPESEELSAQLDQLTLKLLDTLQNVEGQIIQGADFVSGEAKKDCDQINKDVDNFCKAADPDCAAQAKEYPYSMPVQCVQGSMWNQGCILAKLHLQDKMVQDAKCVPKR